MATPVLRGHCDCGGVEFELREPPLFVHACHCLNCKRKTGSSFGITCIVLEADIEFLRGKLATAKLSPRTTAHSCTLCETTIFRTSILYEATAWLQPNCLEDLRLLNIGAHIWVKRKDPWLQLPNDVPQFEEGYHRDGVWPESSIERVEAYMRGAT